MNTQAQFNDAFKAAQDPRVIAAGNISDPLDRWTALVALGRQGLKICAAVFMGGWDPWTLMNAATMFGIPYVAGVLDTSPLVAGAPLPPKPADAIDVVNPETCDIAALYPPFVVPPAQHTPTLTPPFVGAPWNAQYPGYFFATPNGSLEQGQMKDGQTISENGAIFVPFKLVGLAGYTNLWKQVS